MNKIIIIGYMGVRNCYLNINEDEAIERYCKSEDYNRKDFEEDFEIEIKTIEFNDEFGCYDIWNNK